MNKDIQNIINKYITYSSNSLDKLVKKNNHIRKKIDLNIIKLRDLSLFDLLLKSISIGYGGFWIIYSEYTHILINKKYNECKYNYLYKINIINNRIYIELNTNILSTINLDTLAMF